jgi:hypothetical protein
MLHLDHSGPSYFIGASLSETVNTFWQGPALPPLVRACLRSFVRQGHTVQLYSYEKLELPSGVSAANAADIIPADQVSRSPGGIATFTDLFRYQLLRDRGGWWVDTDVYCLAPELPAGPRAWADESDGLINNAILKFPAGDPLCVRLVEAARERIANLTRWGAIGPALLTEVVAGPPQLEHAGSRAAFYPLHWLEAHYVWLPEHRAEVDARLEGGMFLHLWMKALTDCGIPLHQAPPAGSWLASVTGDEAWPRRKLPWHDWRTRRAIERYHGAPSVRRKLACIEHERAARANA